MVILYAVFTRCMLSRMIDRIACITLFSLMLQGGLFFGQLHAEPVLYTANAGNSVSVIEAGSPPSVSDIMLPADVRPAALCVNPVTPHLYILDSKNNTVIVLDLVSRSIVTTVSDGRFNGITSLACSPRGTRVYLTVSDAATSQGSLYFLDTSSYALTGSSAIGASPSSMVFNSGGSRLYVLNAGSLDVSVVDTTGLSDSTIESIPIVVPANSQVSPLALAMKDDDVALYLLKYVVDNSSISTPLDVIDLVSRQTVTNQFPLMYPSSIHVSRGSKTLFVSDIAKISLYDTSAGLALKGVIPADSAVSMFASNDGSRLFTVPITGDMIQIFDPASLTQLVPITLTAGGAPQVVSAVSGVRHLLSVRSSGDGGGEVGWPFGYSHPAIRSSSVSVPETIPLTTRAVADSCSTVSWSGCDTSTGDGGQEAYCSLMPFALDKSISVTFSPKPRFPVSTTTTAGGTLSCPSEVCGGGSLVCTVAPNAGYRLSHLTDNGIDITAHVDPAGSLQIAAVSVAHALVAQFTLKSYAVTATAGSGGSVSPSSQQTVSHGDRAIFTVIPDAGKTIASVTGCSGTLNGSTYTTGPISGDCTVLASFDSQAYLITTGVSGTGGSVVCQPSVVISGQSSDCTVTPAAGYHLDTLNDNGNLVAPDGNVYTIAGVSAHHDIVALFTLNQYTVSISPGPGGVISGVSTVSHGDKPVYSIIPQAGFHVEDVRVNGVSVGAVSSYSFSSGVSGSVTISAVFGRNSYMVTPTSGAGGSISPSAVQSVTHGNTASFTITPATGYHLDAVTGSCGGSLNGTTFVTAPVTANCTVTPSFVINSYMVTPTAGANGSITPMSSQVATHGNSVSFTVTPSAGYHTVTPVGGTCGGTLNGNTFTTASVTGDCTVTVLFAINSYAVTPSPGSGGGISPSSGQAVNHGSTVSFTVTPSTGYHIDSVTGCNGTLTDSIYTTGAVTGNCTVTALFAINSYIVTPSAGSGGSMSPGSGQAVAYGNTVSFTVTPSTGHHIVSVTGCNGTLSGSTYTTGALTGDCTVSASFELNTYSINVTASSGGAVSPPAVQTVAHGATARFELTPDAGHSIVSAAGCDGTISGSTFTTAPAANDCTVTVSFIVNTYALTFAASSNGTISGESSQLVNYGADSAAVTAVAAAGHHFVSWTGPNGFVSTANPLTVTNVAASQSLTAGFAVNTYTVTPSGGIGGGVTPAGGQTVTFGNTVSFTVTPINGCHISSVTGCGGTLAGSTYTTGAVTADCTVYANFAIDSFDLTFTSGGNGSIGGSVSQSVGYGGSTSSVTAMTAAGYHFVNWTGTNGFATTSANPLTVLNVTASHAITANFAVDVFTVSFVSGGNGTLNGTIEQSVSYGGSASPVTAIPPTGYHFVNWTGTNGFVTTTVNPLTLTNVTSSQLITANFAINSYTVTPAAGSGGSMSPPAALAVNHGNSVSFTLTPLAGYHIGSVSGCSGILNGSTYTTGAVTADCTVSASFAADTYSVTFASGGNGTISGTASQSIGYGGSSTAVSAVPASGYHFVNWSAANGLSSTDNPLTLAGVFSDVTVTAHFALNQYMVTASVPGGHGVVACPSSVSHGSSVTCTITPDSGYRLSSLRDNGATVTLSPGATVYDVSAVTGDHSLLAQFTVASYSVTATVTPAGSAVIQPSPSQTVTPGGSVTFTFAAASGYRLLSASSTCGGALNGSSYVINSVTGDCAVSAILLPVYQVTASTISGSGTVSCPSAADAGSTVTCSIVPTPGYHVSSLKDNGVEMLGAGAGKSSYQIAAVAWPHLIQATFEQYSLADALEALRIAVGISASSSRARAWLDVAPLDPARLPLGDGTVDISDALALLRRHLGLYGW